MSDSPADFFARLIGKWSGSCKTWFRPGELADESPVEGEIFQGLIPVSLRHVYQGQMQGKTRAGEEWIAHNQVTGDFQISWIDDFHMSTAILFSVGPGIGNGFSVTGHYDVGDGHPQWGWRTQWVLQGDQLVTTAFNITPEGEEAKAVEVIYKRVQG